MSALVSNRISIYLMAPWNGYVRNTKAYYAKEIRTKFEKKSSEKKTKPTLFLLTSLVN